MARKGVVVYSSFPGHSFLGGGASDCGTLTIRRAARPSVLVLLILFGDESVERERGGVDRRGALLGPEESGQSW